MSGRDKKFASSMEKKQKKKEDAEKRFVKHKQSALFQTVELASDSADSSNS